MQYNINNNNYSEPSRPYDGPYGGGASASAGGYVVANVSAVMKRVYLQMTLGLVVTAITALLCNNLGFIDVIRHNGWIMWALVIAEFGLVIGISAGINKLSSVVAFALFLLFAVVNGLMLSPIFVIYTGESIASTFFITAGTFAAMSAYGYFTNRDLSKMGTILIMALFGLIIATVVNLFIGSETMQWIISFAGVLIFTGLTAWDTQAIKRMAMTMPASHVGRLAVIGALNLYLDFINLFLYLLRFFGNRN